MPYSESNASYQALTLLGEFFGGDAKLLRELWGSLCGVLKESNETIRYRDDSWEQDWFLAKFAAEGPAGTRAWYDPTVDFYSFPTFDVDIHTSYLRDRHGIAVRQTRNNVDLGDLFSRTATAFAGPMVLDEFHDLQSQIRAQADPAMAQFNHALSWLNVGLGKIFGGVVLTPNLELQTAVDALLQRWRKAWAEEDPYESWMSVPELLQWKLDVFYGAEMNPSGHLVFQPARQGQPWRWQQYWQWLAAGIEPQRALDATRLAAGLMICPPPLVFLKVMLRGGQDEISPLDRLMALVVLRRLTLQLQAMAWFEHALEHSFAHARVQDLASFAFSAVRPHWPRRLLALSHRSKDVKAALMGLQCWGNFRYSVDAMFVPHWETNVGMIWGLFSSVPGLIRIRSPNYDGSIWCRREQEIFNYLRDEDDFLRGRLVIEIDETHLPLLDAVIPPSSVDSIVRPGQFPPWTSVFMVFPFEPWECRLLACAAVTRFLFSILGKAAETATVCQQLAQGNVPRHPPLTNHPDGWAAIMQLLHDFQHEWSDDLTVFPMGIDDQRYTEEDARRDLECIESLIDLSDGLIDQPAAFAALEWNRTLAPALIGNGRYGRFFAVDYRHTTPDLWHSEAYMVIRGLGRVRAFAPIWIVQRADQRIDEWPGMGTNPIFTQHLDKQLSWMMELLDSPTWPELYLEESKLVFAPKLREACAATKTRGSDYYQGKVR